MLDDKVDLAVAGTVRSAGLYYMFYVGSSHKPKIMHDLRPYLPFLDILIHAEQRKAVCVRFVCARNHSRMYTSQHI